MRLSRRTFLEASAALARRLLGLSPALAQTPPHRRRRAAGAARFGYDDVVRRARELAAAALRRHRAARCPSRSPGSISTPSATSASGPTGRCWADAAARSGCRCSIPGFLFTRPVTVNVIRDGIPTPVPYSASLFDYGRNKFDRPLPVNLGFAGFRLHYPLNDPKVHGRADLVPRRELFPLPRPRASATACRRAASPSAWAATRRRSFRFFREFWIEQRRRRMPTAPSIYALLDSAVA